MIDSNLSKIKPKLRTEGRVSGNFGKSKVKAGSPIVGIGVTNAKVVNITTPNDYLKRLYLILDTSEDVKMRKFAYDEIKKILIQRGEWK
jgi:hypothetical protein